MVEWESVSANQQGGFQVFDTSLQSQPFGLKLKGKPLHPARRLEYNFRREALPSSERALRCRRFCSTQF